MLVLLWMIWVSFQPFRDSLHLWFAPFCTVCPAALTVCVQQHVKGSNTHIYKSNNWIKEVLCMLGRLFFCTHGAIYWPQLKCVWMCAQTCMFSSNSSFLCVSHYEFSINKLCNERRRFFCCYGNEAVQSYKAGRLEHSDEFGGRQRRIDRQHMQEIRGQLQCGMTAYCMSK